MWQQFEDLDRFAQAHLVLGRPVVWEGVLILQQDCRCIAGPGSHHIAFLSGLCLRLWLWRRQLGNLVQPDSWGKSQLVHVQLVLCFRDDQGPCTGLLSGAWGRRPAGARWQSMVRAVAVLYKLCSRSLRAGSRTLGARGRSEPFDTQASVTRKNQLSHLSGHCASVQLGVQACQMVCTHRSWTLRCSTA